MGFKTHHPQILITDTLTAARAIVACEYSRLSVLRPLAAFGGESLSPPSLSPLNAASGRSAERRLYSQARAIGARWELVEGNSDGP